MNELELYYDSNLTKKVFGKIEFDTIESGKKSTRELWVKSKVMYPVAIDMTVKGSNVIVRKEIRELPAEGVDNIIFEFNPKLFTKEPIKLDLHFRYEYIVR